jgi:hypothetical protein
LIYAGALDRFVSRSLVSDDLLVAVQHPWLARRGQGVVLPVKVFGALLQLLVNLDHRLPLHDIIDGVCGDDADGGPLTVNTIISQNLNVCRRVLPVLGVEIKQSYGHWQASFAKECSP